MTFILTLGHKLSTNMIPYILSIYHTKSSSHTSSLVFPITLIRGFNIVWTNGTKPTLPSSAHMSDRAYFGELVCLGEYNKYYPKDALGMEEASGWTIYTRTIQPERLFKIE